MKKFPIVFIFLLFMMLNCWSQEKARKILNGKVIVDLYNLEDIDVINMQTEKFKRTQTGGYFTVEAKEGDTLMFSGTNIKGFQLLICEEDLEKDLLFVKLETVAKELSEVVVVNYNHINSVSLGIVSANQKKYTPAERKLKAASKGFLSVDPVLNFFSGKTAKLKRDVATEKKEILLKLIEELFEDVVLINRLEIPTEYIKGFQYFLVENKRFVQLVEGNDTTLRDFVLTQLAMKYKKMMAYEE